MKRRTIIGIFVVYVLVMLGVYAALIQGRTVSLFDTQGTIADQEKGLIIFTIMLGLGVVIPVILMTFVIAWRYREGNHKATYRPDWSGNLLAESIWWAIPTIIIGILAVVIFQSSHALDPFKPLNSSITPVRVQVVALDWRWLFIYPDQKIASINYLKFPVNTPVNFTITSDAPMNSFWIPQLSGQIYAMSGMSSQLHLSARTVGDYRGMSANISGLGFSGMHFTASAVSQSDFTTWMQSLHKATPLTRTKYDQLAQKSCDSSRYSYRLADANLYNEIIDKYMDPSAPQPSNQASDATSDAAANCNSPSITTTITKQIEDTLLGKH